MEWQKIKIVNLNINNIITGYILLKQENLPGNEDFNFNILENYVNKITIYLRGGSTSASGKFRKGNITFNENSDTSFEYSAFFK